MEENNFKVLMSQKDIKSAKKERQTYLLTWLLSNILSVAFPIGAIALVGYFQINGKFNIKENYSEMLMATISISMNIMLQLNSKDYNIEEYVNRFIRLIAIGILVTASLSYGIAKALVPNIINIDVVFKFSTIIMGLTFLIGFICEINRKRRY